MKKKNLLIVIIFLSLGILFKEGTNLKNIDEENLDRPAPGTEDNPDAASEYRFEMLGGNDKNVDLVQMRREAVKYTKEEMQTFNYENQTDNSTSGWTSLGPGNIGGRVRSLVINPNNSNFILIGAVAGGVWKTTNGGSSWIPKLDSANPIAIGSLAMDPNNANIVYAGSGEGWTNTDAVYGGGVYKSTNFGDTWTLLPNTIGANDKNFRNVMKIVCDNSGKVYAATRNSRRIDGLPENLEGGLFKSVNGGDTWNRISIYAESQYFMPTDMIIIDEDTIIYATDNFLVFAGGIFKTKDKGVSWKRLSDGLPDSTSILNNGRISLAQDPSNLHRIYAVIAKSKGDTTSGGLINIYKSDTWGEKWNTVNRPQRINSTGLKTYLGEIGWYANTIAVDPFDSLKLFVGGVDMMKSVNRGTSWTQVTFWNNSYGNPVVHADHHVIAFDPNNQNAFYNANDGGIYRTGNLGANWQNKNNALEITQFYSGAVFKNGNIYYGGTQDNGHLKYNNTTVWNEVYGGDGGYSAQDQQDNRISYEEYVHLEIRKTVNSGVDWNEAITGLTDAKNASLCLFIAPFSLNPENDNCLIAGSDKVWITNNKAGAWTKSSDPLAAGNKISAVTVVKNAADYIGYAGTTNGKIFRCTALDPDAGVDNWNEATPAGNNGQWVRRIIVNLNHKDTIYACYSGYNTAAPLQSKHVWYSKNKGAAWTDISGNLPNVPVHSLVIDPFIDSVLYAGTETGVYVTTNRGTTWASFNFGMPLFAPVYELVLQKETNKLFAFTHGRSVWEIKNPSTIIAVALVIQGLYNPFTKKTNRKDTVKTELRNSTSPYSVVDSSKAVIDSVNFTGEFIFKNISDGNYFLVIRHWNSIETWSSSGINVIQGDINNYDFTISQSQAFGSNEILVDNSPVTFAIYSGDVNQDGAVDGSDGALIDNDASNFITGYVQTDVTGDYIVDGSDMVIADNNAANFIGVIRP